MQQTANDIKLRVVFMGTSDLSEQILDSLIENKYNLVGVFTKPDMKVGRKQEIVAPPVKVLAEKNSIPVFQPEKFKAEAIEQLKELKPDIVIVAAYGKILPKAALEIPGFGCINVHVSLLPKYRGPSPVQNALLNGEKESGVTIMLMDQGVDTGDILLQEKIGVDPKENAASLMQKLSFLGSKALLEALPLWIQRKIEATPQDNSKATLCQLIEREDGHIFWEESAESIYNRYRALTPWPGIFSFWKSGNETVRIKLLEIELQKINPEQSRQSGEVFEIGSDIGVQTAEGVIILKKIHREGKKPTDPKSFANGTPEFIGSILF
ncbi:MAG TPA: methionyl-tRNA formyltransferase [Patescibacteria group bacterium]